MKNLFDSGDYHWSLFIGHLVLEKLLKAVIVYNYSENPPITHNLLRLAEKADLELNDTQKDELATITSFNIQARYDDIKMVFYKSCTKEFASRWIEVIK